MAADYAGAVGAIKQRFIDAWVVDGSPRTPIGYVNGDVDPSANNPSAWVEFEVVHSGSLINGSGLPGNHVIIYYGSIKGHVFVPSGSGLGEIDNGGLQLALAIGEIFRNALFYNTVTDGCFVRSGYDIQNQPRIDDGDLTSDDGQWFAVTATIGFEYWHRG